MSEKGGWWSVFYAPKDLVLECQCFLGERRIHNLIRIAMLLLNLNNVLLIYHLGGAVKLFGFFTNWTVMATTIYFAVSLVATKPNASNSILALHHLLFQISMMMNFVTMTVYWTTGLH